MSTSNHNAVRGGEGGEGGEGGLQWTSITGRSSNIPGPFCAMETGVKRWPDGPLGL